MPVFDKLNLGCGVDIRPDFLNIDIQSLPGVDFVCDARDLEAIEDSSVKFIVAQHFLEYIPRQDMISSFLEWKRILKPGGLLEIRSTDISQLTKALYLHGISPEMGLHDEMVISLLYGQQLHEYDIRCNGFTPSFLQGVLVGCGFTIQGNVIEDLDFITTARK
jgi:hypothetical protein